MDFLRLRGYFPPLIATAAMVAALSTLLGVAIEGATPHRVVLDHLDPNRQAALARRIVRVEAATTRAGGMIAPAGLGVLLGQSTVREGIDERVLGRATELRWLNLGASGGSFLQLSYYSRPLFDSELRPRVVVVGVHVQWLASPEARTQAQRVRLQGGGPLERLWFWRERNTMRNLGGFWTGAARRAWFSRWSQPLAVQIVPGRGEGFADDGPVDEDPFAAPRKYRTPRAPEHRITQLMEHVADYGWFSAAAYDASGAEARALVGLWGELMELAPVVVVVLMPEDPSLRAAVPGVAHDVFDGLVLEARRMRSDFGPAHLLVLDHRCAMDEQTDIFYDPAHLNGRGRQLYSELLGRSLAPILEPLR